MQRLRALLFLPLCVDAVHLRGAPTPARTLVFNASVIHTMGGAANDETAEAFCVENGRFTSVGTLADVREACGSQRLRLRVAVLRGGRAQGVCEVAESQMQCCRV